jgi:hypothetical protein
MSVPALKTWLVPVSTATRNTGSASNMSNAADNSSAICWSIALRLSGRFIAINRTWLRISVRTLGSALTRSLSQAQLSFRISTPWLYSSAGRRVMPSAGKIEVIPNEHRRV